MNETPVELTTDERITVLLALEHYLQGHKNLRAVYEEDPEGYAASLKRCDDQIDQIKALYKKFLSM